MKSKKEVATFLQSLNPLDLIDELAIEGYCRRIGFNISFIHKPENTQKITFKDFVDWFENDLATKNDIIVLSCGTIGVVKKTTYNKIILGAYLKTNGEFIDTQIEVKADSFRAANQNERIYLQEAFNQRNIAWNRFKSKIIRRLDPQHNQQLRITILGDKIGLGVLREIKKNGDVIMYCCLKINGTVHYSLYENIGNKEQIQLEVPSFPERRIFAEELAKFGKVWNGKLKRIEPINYRADLGQTFTFINMFWEVEVSSEQRRQKNQILFKSSNYFRTRENCEKIIEVFHSERKRYPIQNRCTQGSIYYFINENWEIQETVENNKPKDSKLHNTGNYFSETYIPQCILTVVTEERKKQLVKCYIDFPKKRGRKPTMKDPYKSI